MAKNKAYHVSFKSDIRCASQQPYLQDLHVSELGEVAVEDALVQIAAMDQLHDQACIARILEAGAINLHGESPQDMARKA